MLGKFFECEADKNERYYRFIQTERKYEDGRSFPIDEIVKCDKKINFNAEDKSQMGGFFISDKDYIFRWVIRGDTLCEVVIPENEKIYKTACKYGIYLANSIILTNPIKVSDEYAMKLYLQSKLLDNEYFKAMTACAICGYINTALKVCEDKVNTENVNQAIEEFEGFCQRRNDESFIDNEIARENVNKLYEKLINIKNRGEN